MPFLILNRNGDEVAFKLDRDVTTIGRSSENHISIDDTKSSRKHCALERVGRGFKLVDLESKNGTQLNGVEVHAADLAPGDRISIGSTHFIFQEDREVTHENVSFGLTGKQDLLTVDGANEPRSYDEIAEELRALRKLLLATRNLSRELKLDSVLHEMLDAAIDLTGAERGFLLVMQDGEQEIRVARNFERATIEAQDQQFSGSLCQQVMDSGQAILTANAIEDERFRDAHSVHALALRSVICAPIEFREEMLGVVYLDNRVKQGAFTKRHLELVETFFSQSAIALNNAKLHQKLLDSYRYIEALNKQLETDLKEKTAKLETLQLDLVHKQSALETRYSYGKIIGKSRKMQELYRLLDKIIETDVPVIIQGESGTGKELVARAIHFNGPRKEKPFVSENCAAISETLLESELFGYEPGAFTGATKRKLGLFELADGGTLFLDELGETSIEMQKKLLRVLQEGEIRRVGGKDKIPVNVRIVTATNQDLRAMVDKETFRQDLYFRLKGVALTLPPLRERSVDIPDLVAHFLEWFAVEGQPPKEMDPRAMEMMANYAWPGNIRELENEVRKMVALSGPTIGIKDLSPEVRGELTPARGFSAVAIKGSIKDMVESLERRMIKDALETHGGNKTKTAGELGLSRLGLRKKLERYGIEG